MSLTMHSLAQRLSEDVAAQTEKKIVEQLRWLVSRDLLEMRSRGVTLVRTHDDQLEARTEVELVLKNADYIEKLEATNADLKTRVAGYEKLFGALYDAAKAHAKGTP